MTDQIVAALILAVETLREQLLRERDRADRAERLLAECSTSLSLYKESKTLEREEERECVRVAAREADGLSDLWREAALTERRQADLPDVDLDSEWRKLVLYDDGKEIRLCRWLKWARGARLDHTNQPRQPAPTSEEPRRSHAASGTLESRVTDFSPAAGAIPSDDVAADIKERSELRQYFASGGRYWPANRGPRPGEEGCRYPAALIEDCFAKMRVSVSG